MFNYKQKNYMSVELSLEYHYYISVFAWIKLTPSQPAEASGMIFEKDNYFFLSVRNEQSAGIFNQLQTYTYQDLGGGNWDQLDGNTQLEEDRWYYVGVTRTTDTVTLYVDGVVDADRPTATRTISGVYNIGSRVGVTYPFHGKIRNLSVYDRVLSTSEILENYNHGRLRMFGIK